MDNCPYCNFTLTSTSGGWGCYGCGAVYNLNGKRVMAPTRYFVLIKQLRAVSCFHSATPFRSQPPRDVLLQKVVATFPDGGLFRHEATCPLCGMPFATLWQPHVEPAPSQESVRYVSPD